SSPDERASSARRLDECCTPGARLGCGIGGRRLGSWGTGGCAAGGRRSCNDPATGTRGNNPCYRPFSATYMARWFESLGGCDGGVAASQRILRDFARGGD